MRGGLEGVWGSWGLFVREAMRASRAAAVSGWLFGAKRGADCCGSGLGQSVGAEWAAGGFVVGALGAFGRFWGAGDMGVLGRCVVLRGHLQGLFVRGT